MKIDRAAACLALLCLALLAGCATRPTHPDAFYFGVVGDAQYNAGEEAVFPEMLEYMGRDQLAFIVHVGDIMGRVDCSDALYARRKVEFDASAHPFIYTPGDNEWTDCRQPARGGHDPIERLAKLRQVFFSDRFSLGRKRMELLVQTGCAEPRHGGGCACLGIPENRFWTRGGVRFVTLSVPGSENNVGHNAANDDEAACRNAANRAWLEQAIELAARSQTRGFVIFIHANPWDSKHNNYVELLRHIDSASRRIGKPVLLVHGDSHVQRVDQPFAQSATFGSSQGVQGVGALPTSVTRLETFGSPMVGWVKVTVDPDDPNVFAFEPKLYKVVKP